MPVKKKQPAAEVSDAAIEPDVETVAAIEPADLSWIEPKPGFKSGYAAVVGKPNAGKSTLINLFVGRKVTIVSPRPQTTRRRILGVMSTPDYQIVFVDTPGLHAPKHKLGQQMVDYAMHALPDADLVLWVCDASHTPGSEDRYIADTLQREVKAPVILVLNKMDELPPEKVVPNTEAYLALLPPDAWMMISATRGHNKEKLLDLILERLPEGPPYFPPDQLSNMSDRLFAAEVIREKALLNTYEEVPHGIAVVVEQWEDRPRNMLYIAATIYVERETHKSILIGDKGQKLKTIGQKARQELEFLLGRRLYLELWVKVRERWRDNPMMIRQLEPIE